MTRETDVFLEGINRPVGRLTGAPDLSLSFRYSADGLSANRALSLSLPVREEAYGDPAARAFFGNLLNENNALDSVMARHGIARNDIAGLLFHLGRDCPGALSCVPPGFNGTLRSRASALLQSVADAIEPHAGGQKLLGDMIADQVLRLSDILELDVTVPERDLFVQEGGGFRISS